MVRFCKQLHLPQIVKRNQRGQLGHIKWLNSCKYIFSQRKILHQDLVEILIKYITYSLLLLLIHLILGWLGFGSTRLAILQAWLGLILLVFGSLGNNLAHY